MTEAQEFDLHCSAMPSVTIYSDGSFKPALGTGGYGTIMTCNGYSRFFYGGFVGTSNNAMELMGVLVALRALTCPCRVHIISDSRYVVDGINSWMMGWKANNWRKSTGGAVANCELWKEMFNFSQHHLITATWIKGHAGNFSNATCDQFATIGSYSVIGAEIPPHLLSINRL